MIDKFSKCRSKYNLAAKGIHYRGTAPLTYSAFEKDQEGYYILQDGTCYIFKPENLVSKLMTISHKEIPLIDWTKEICIKLEESEFKKNFHYSEYLRDKKLDYLLY